MRLFWQFLYVAMFIVGCEQLISIALVLVSLSLELKIHAKLITDRETAFILISVAFRFFVTCGAMALALGELKKL